MYLSTPYMHSAPLYQVLKSIINAAKNTSLHICTPPPELIGVISAVVGIAATAVDITRGIIGVIDGMKNAPKNIQQLQQELTDLQAILGEIATPRKDFDEKYEDSITQMAVRSCLAELQKLRDIFEPFQLDAKDGLRKRFRMHMQGEGEIKEIVEKLQSRKLTLCLALMTSMSGRIPNGGNEGYNLQRTMAGLQRTNSIDALKKETSDVWVGIAIQNINQKVTAALDKFIKNPNINIEDLLELDRAQSQDFWRMDLGSINQLRDTIRRQKQERLLESLYAPDYQKDRLDIKDASASTCEWILDQPQYLSWRHSTESCALHVYGKPGSGKSVLSKSVLERLSATRAESDTKEQDVSLLYYFCSNRNRPDEAASSILRALIHQLIHQKINLVETILQSSELTESHPFLKKTGISTWSLETLWKMFTLLVANSQFRVVYCIIDGLDESERTSAETLLSLVTELLGRRTAGPVFKLLLTSRPEEYIEEGVEDYAFRIRIDSDVIKHDISRFVSERLGKIKKRLRLKPQEELELRENFVTRAEGMFLWAKLAMEEAEKTRGLTTKKLKSFIKTLPSGLNGLYKRILEKIDAECVDNEDLRLVQKILTWVVLATRPLTLAELRVCLVLEPGMNSLDPDDLMRNIRQDVQALCGSFIEIIPGKMSAKDQPQSPPPAADTDAEEDEDLSPTVRLVHQSAKDYLIDVSYSLDGSLSKFRISAQNGHNEIALICLNYLLFEEFQDEPLISEIDLEHECVYENNACIFDPRPRLEVFVEQYQKMLDDHGFLDYAANYWPFHTRLACKASRAHEVITLASDFLNNHPMHFKTWDQISVWLHLMTAVPNILEITPDLLVRTLDRYTKKNSGLNAAAFHGLTDVIKHLLDVENLNPNTPDEKGYTPLMVVLGSTHQAEVDDVSEIVKLLLEKGVDIETNQPDGCTALYLAAKNNYPVPVKMLIESGANINAESEDGWGVLQRAAENGSPDLVNILLDKGADIEGKVREAGWFALALAAKNDHIGVVQLLLERGASHETHTHFHRYPLHVQAEYGNSPEVINLLLDKGADIDKIDSAGCTPLLDALKEGKLDIAKLLLRRGANAGKADALHIAARRGYLDIAQILLDKGTYVEALDDIGWNALQMAAESGHFSIVKLLLDRGANIDKRTDDAGWFPLALAAKNNHLEVVQLLLERGASHETHTHFHRYSLHVQAEYGNSPEVINLLLDKGADIDKIDNAGCTPLLDALKEGKLDIATLLLYRGANAGKADALHVASRRGYLDIAQLLLDKGTDIEAPNEAGWSALHMAAEEGHSSIVKLLLDGGANIEKKTTEAGWFPLALAAKSDHVETVKLLLDKGADANSCTDFGRTALHVQAEYGNSQGIVNLLLDKRVNTEIADNSGCTPLLDAFEAEKIDTARLLLLRGANAGKADALRLAARRGLLDMAKLLLATNIDIDAANDEGWNALQMAAEDGHSSLVELLLDRGADIEKKTKDAGWFALALAAKGDHLETVKLLLDRGADVNGCTDFGRTALHVQAEYGNSQNIVGILLDHGADIEKVDNGSWTPLLDAIDAGKTETAKLLLDRGANNKDDEIFNSAVQKGLVEVVQILLDLGADLKTIDYPSSLNAATQQGFQELVQLLLSHGADPKVVTKESLHVALDGGFLALATILMDGGAGANQDDYSILLDAASSSCKPIIELLLSLGRDIEQTDEDGWNALHFSAYQDDMEIATLLLDKGIKINTAESSGQTAIALATQEGNLDIAALLLERGADITPLDEDGWSVIHIAAEKGHLSLIRSFLEVKPDTDLEIMTNDGWFLLSLAADGGHLELVEFLLDRGANINRCNDSLRTSLHITAECSDKLETIQLLLDRGANIDPIDHIGFTPLTKAVSLDHLGVVGILLDRGADISIANLDGKSAVHMAAENGLYRMAELLISRGADITTVTNEGLTAHTLAIKKGHTELAILLQIE